MSILPNFDVREPPVNVMISRSNFVHIDFLSKGTIWGGQAYENIKKNFLYQIRATLVRML